MIDDDDQILCDKEVAQMLKISPSCLRHQAEHGPAKPGARVLDVRLAEPIVIAGMRRWSKARLMALLKRYK